MSSGRSVQPVPLLIALGSNQGDRQRILDEAVTRLQKSPETFDWEISPWFETPPSGYLDQPDFLNGAAFARTLLDPNGLLQILQETETLFGKSTPFRNGPRTLDLDLLWFGTERIQTPTLILPHPRWSERSFVVRPLLALSETLAENENFPSAWHQSIRAAATTLSQADPDWSKVIPYPSANPQP